MTSSDKDYLFCSIFENAHAVAGQYHLRCAGLAAQGFDTPRDLPGIPIDAAIQRPVSAWQRCGLEPSAVA